MRRTLSAPTATYISPRNESPDDSHQHTPISCARNRGRHCGWNAAEGERKPAFSLLLSHGVVAARSCNTGGAPGDKRGHRPEPVTMDGPGWRLVGPSDRCVAQQVFSESGSCTAPNLDATRRDEKTRACQMGSSRA